MNRLLCNELHEEYIKLIEERFNLYFTYIKEYNNSFNKLNNESRNKLELVFNDYLKSYKIYKKVLNFIMFYNNKIIYDNAIYIMDLLNDRFEDIIIYINNILDEFDIATSMKLDYKFNIKDNNIFLNNNDYNYYINYIKGFNIDNVSNYLINNEVYTPNTFDDAYNKVKIINCSKDDYEIFSGINNNGDIMVPEIKDELSTLINIHELVHKALLNKNDNNELITYSEILPIFYEMLFIKQNYFCNKEIHYNKIADILLKDYHDEPFDIQIKKLKKVVN